MGRGKLLDNKQVLFSGNLGGRSLEKDVRARFMKPETISDRDTCPECEGLGFFTDAINNQSHDCSACSGQGYFNAVIKRRVCEFCKNDGSDCFECFNGVKTIRTIDINCPDCKNNLVSKAKCETCESYELQTVEKRITCSGCSGTGKDEIDPTLNCMVCFGNKYNVLSTIKKVPGTKKTRSNP